MIHHEIRWNVTKSTLCPSCLVLSLHVHMRLHHSIGDGENVGGSPGNGDVYAVWRDGIGRKVTPQGQRALPTISAPPPAPELPRARPQWPAAARRARPCPAPRPSAAAPCPAALSGRYASRAPPAPWLAPELRGAPAGLARESWLVLGFSHRCVLTRGCGFVAAWNPRWFPSS